MRVHSITFNYSSQSGYNLPLNLRYNYNQPIEIPEYSYAIKSNCPVCYCSDMVNDGLVIKVRFEDDEKKFENQYLIIRGLASDRKNILGTTKEHKVGFVDGCSQGGSINFVLDSNKISEAILGKFNCCYKWQYKEEGSDTWTDFDSTNHTVYVIPHKSLSPMWETNSFNSHYVPWADTLNCICESFAGSTVTTLNDDSISEHIAKLINSDNFQYDTNGACNYSTIGRAPDGSLYPVFNAYRFMDNYLKATSTNKLSVNCNDCACINTFFLSLLGIKNEVSYLSSDNEFKLGFGCNEIISIGFSEWKVPFSESKTPGMFRYHAVCTYTFGTMVTDSCLQIDRGDNPWGTDKAVKIGGVACKTVFADPATTPENLPKAPYAFPFYRERLCNMATLEGGLCKVVFISDRFEFSDTLYKIHMKSEEIRNDILKAYSDELTNKVKADAKEELYSFADISSDNLPELSTEYINNEKSFCSLTSDDEKYKDISTNLYFCDDLQGALSCADSLVFSNSGYFISTDDFSDICDIAVKSSSEKMIIAVKGNTVAEIKTQNSSEDLSEFAKELLKSFS